MNPPVTIWDSRVDDDDPIAYVYDAAGTIQQRIYRQHTGNDEGRQWVWFCTCPKGNQYGAPRIAGDEKRDTRCDHLRRFMAEATAGQLGPGIVLTEYGRGVANTSCACNTGRRLEETPIPDRPVKEDRGGLNSKQWREKLRAEKAERDRLEGEAAERAEAERKRGEELEAQWKVRYDERTRMARARIAQVEAEIAAERAAEEKARAKRKTKSAPKATAPAKKKASTKKAPAKKRGTKK